MDALILDWCVWHISWASAQSIECISQTCTLFCWGSPPTSRCAPHCGAVWIGLAPCWRFPRCLTVHTGLRWTKMAIGVSPVVVDFGFAVSWGFEAGGTSFSAGSSANISITLGVYTADSYSSPSQTQGSSLPAHPTACLHSHTSFWFPSSTHQTSSPE